MRDLLDWLSELPRRHLHAWLLWLVVAIVLSGLSVVFSPTTANTVIAAFRLLPRWLQILDMAWLAIAAILLIQNIVTRGREAQGRLDRIEHKVDLLLLTLGATEVPLGNINVPPPSPQRKIGWVGAVTDTTKAGSFSKVDPRRANAIFERVTEPTAVVNAAIDQRITLDKIVLDRASGVSGESGSNYTALLQLTNKTSKPLSLRVSKGQVFENASPSKKVQNLVVAQDATVTCAAGASASVTLPAYCLNKHLPPPTGNDGNITPLKVKFTFDSQRSLWDRVDAALK